MPFCANCDEWFEGQNKNKATCEHCGQINPLEIIENQDAAPETWSCRDYFEIRARLYRLKLFVLLPLTCAIVASIWFPVLGIVLICLTTILALFVWGLQRVLLIASQEGETHIFRLITCYGFVLSQKERTPDKTGPVVIQLVNLIDPQTKETIERRMVCLDRFTITGFGTRDGGLRFARILADHCGLQMQRLFGA